MSNKISEDCSSGLHSYCTPCECKCHIEYHTMSELYEHRYALFAALIKIYDGYITPLGPTPVRAWKSRLHDDGTMFDDSFVCGLTRRNISGPDLQISYHLPLSWWDKVNCLILPNAPKYDGYTSNDVIERLLKL